MLRQISWKQLHEWIAYAELEPFDETRADYRAASICTLLANINRNPKKQPRAFEIQDFLLLFGEDKKPKKQTWQQQKMIAQMIAMAYGEPGK
jgi:Protein of unknown function (DUF4035)